LSTRVEAKLETMPSKPGVYMFSDGQGRVIYVGKAKSLRSRVRSYFGTPSGADSKGQRLRDEIADLEVTVCRSEVDALILESILIKKHRPRFNVILRDDKSYPYIAVTVSDEFPRAGLVRGERVEGVRYYGPYVSVRAARNTLRLLHKVFPLRHCGGGKPGQRGGTPCLYRQMKMCLGPCTGDVDREEYRRCVKSFCDFLEGRHKSIVEELDTAMREAAGSQEYERAARIRNQIESANRVLSHYRSLSSSSNDYDVVGVHLDQIEACFVVAQNRSGIHIGNLCFFTGLAEEKSQRELVMEFLKRYYDQAASIPEQVFVPDMPDEEAALAEWLSALRGSRVAIHVPLRGNKRGEMALALSNARLAMEGAKMARATDRVRVDSALLDLTTQLGLSRYPLRIECYDISTMGGAASVGSMVTFQDGYPDRRNYRKFAIKFTPGIDDVGMMKEVLYRRFKKLVSVAGLPEGKEPTGGSGFSRKPDMVILDGGKGQLGAGLEVMKILGIEDVEVAALAKKLEEVYRPGSGEPITLPRGSEALFLIQRIRDEAHRVAVSYHRSLMEKSTSSSWLDRVSGVGPERKKALIRHFKSPRRLSKASLEDIMSVKGIPEAVALAVHQAARAIEQEQNRATA